MPLFDRGARRLQPVRTIMTFSIERARPDQVDALCAIERAAVTTVGDTILPDNLPSRILGHSSDEKPKFEIDLKHPLPHYLHLATEQIEREYIHKALEKARGNVGKCAELGGLSRRSVSGKISQYGIDKIPFKSN